MRQVVEGRRRIWSEKAFLKCCEDMVENTELIEFLAYLRSHSAVTRWGTGKSKRYAPVATFDEYPPGLRYCGRLELYVFVSSTPYCKPMRNLCMTKLHRPQQRHEQPTSLGLPHRATDACVGFLMQDQVP